MIIQPNSKGIVTLADKNYFKGLQVLYYSVQKLSDIPIACFDIGLTSSQLEWINNQTHLSVLEIPEDPEIELIKTHLKGDKLLGKKNKRIWPLWICPWLIGYSPYQKTFWIDCDIVILQKVNELFKMLDTGPVFTLENHAPDKTANSPDLYKLLPIEREIGFNYEYPPANGGVSGWDLIRDKHVLDAYKFPAIEACKNKEIEKAISWHDQGCLIWAIQKYKLEERVLKDINWNLCVRHTPAHNKKYLWDKSVIEKLKKDAPNVNLLHWNGQKVPWSD